MIKKHPRFGRGFRVIPGNRASQAAERVQAPGDFLLIERKQKHQVTNTGRGLLRTLNFHVPRADREDGDPRSRGKK